VRKKKIVEDTQVREEETILITAIRKRVFVANRPKAPLRIKDEQQCANAVRIGGREKQGERGLDDKEKNNVAEEIERSVENSALRSHHATLDCGAST